MATRKSPDDGRRRANIHVCCVCVCPGHVCACVCVVCVMCCLVVLACLVGLSCWLVRCCLVVLACLWLCFGLPAMSGPGPRAKLPNGPQRPRGPKHQLSRVSRSPPHVSGFLLIGNHLLPIIYRRLSQRVVDTTLTHVEVATLVPHCYPPPGANPNPERLQN